MNIGGAEMTKNAPTVIDARVSFSTLAPRRITVGPVCSGRDFPSVLIHMRARDVSLRRGGNLISTQIG